MNITIEAYPGKNRYDIPIRGRKKVLVDGVYWGTFIMSQHGCYGAKYTLCDLDEHLIETDRGGQLYVWSEKTHRRRGLIPREVELPPLEERLRDLVKWAIDTGRLKHPDVVKHGREDADRRYQERLKRTEEARMQKLRKRAADFLDRIGIIATREIDLVDALAKEFAAVIELGL